MPLVRVKLKLNCFGFFYFLVDMQIARVYTWFIPGIAARDFRLTPSTTFRWFTWLVNLTAWKSK